MYWSEELAVFGLKNSYSFLIVQPLVFCAQLRWQSIPQAILLVVMYVIGKHAKEQNAEWECQHFFAVKYGKVHG